MNIPTEWQVITPMGQELTPTEVEVERLRRAGFSEERVCCRMHIRREHLHEIINEINRKKAINERLEKESSMARLTEEQREQIRELWRQGLTQAEIAKRVGTSTVTVSKWAHTTQEAPEAQQESHREPEGAEPVQVGAPENPAAESTLERIGGTAQRLMTDEGRKYINRLLDGEVSEVEEQRQAERAAKVLADAARDRIRADEAEIERQETIIREARKRLMTAAQEIDDLKAWLRQQPAAQAATATEGGAV